MLNDEDNNAETLDLINSREDLEKEMAESLRLLQEETARQERKAKIFIYSLVIGAMFLIGLAVVLSR